MLKPRQTVKAGVQNKADSRKWIVTFCWDIWKLMK